MNPAELFRQESNTVQVAPGDFLFQEGEKGDKMYVLLEGEVDIFLGDFVFETAGPGSQSPAQNRRGKCRLPLLIRRTSCRLSRLPGTGNRQAQAAPCYFLDETAPQDS